MFTLRQLSPALKAAICLWMVTFAVILIRVSLSNRQSVYPIFSGGAQFWLRGDDPYVPDNFADVYVYSPPTTLLFVPFAMLPAKFGELLWRIFNFTILIVGLRSFCDLLHDRFNFSTAQIALFLTLAYPLTLKSLNNGQINILLMGLNLLAVTAAGRGRWNLAACSLALAFWPKLYHAALMGLMFLAFSRRLVLRTLAMVIVLFFTPYLFSAPVDALDNYFDFLQTMLGQNRLVLTGSTATRDFSALVRAVGMSIEPLELRAIQFAMAGVVAALAVYFLRSKPRDDAERALMMYELAATWMILFGPATESATYCLLSVPLAYRLVQMRQPADRLRAFPFRVALAVFVIGIVAAIFPGGSAVGRYLQPIAAILVAIGQVACLDWDCRTRPDEDPVDQSSPVAA